MIQKQEQSLKRIVSLYIQMIVFKSKFKATKKFVSKNSQIRKSLVE